MHERLHIGPIHSRHFTAMPNDNIEEIYPLIIFWHIFCVNPEEQVISCCKKSNRQENLVFAIIRLNSDGKLTTMRLSCGGEFFRLANSLGFPWQQTGSGQRRGWLFTHEHSSTQATIHTMALFFFGWFVCLTDTHLKGLQGLVDLKLYFHFLQRANRFLLEAAEHITTFVCNNLSQTLSDQGGDNLSQQGDLWLARVAGSGQAQLYKE